MTKLNQLVALVKGQKDRTNKETALLFQTNPAMFGGLAKTYEPKNEGGTIYPPEAVRVKYTVPEILEAFTGPTGRLLDLISTTENANTEARANVVVDGVTLIEQAPVTFLMQFQKYLEREVRGLLGQLPTLDPAYDWTVADTAGRRGEFQTGIVQRNKTTEQPKVVVLAPATDKHPAQVQMVKETIVEGVWNERRLSGAISARTKQEYIERCDKVIDAVKKAREEANDREVENRPVADDVFSYILG
jgi:hypothetical protein